MTIFNNTNEPIGIVQNPLKDSLFTSSNNDSTYLPNIEYWKDEDGNDWVDENGNNWIA